MIKRALSLKLNALAKKFPVVSIVGPRQSGKTTLVKYVFPGMAYISLENLDTREFAQKDPRAFLSAHKNGLIIDEAQRVPELFSYIQTITDEHGRAGQFILTGSQNYLLMEKISQTLAGRAALLTLLPFSLDEIKGTPYETGDLNTYLFKGLYPRLYDKKIDPVDWYPNYIQTYVERDVRIIKNIGDLNTFQKFIRICAGRIGQVLNLSSMGNDCGITHNTAKAWLSILESSYIIFLLRPYHNNFNKRLIKMPKLYFYDAGLAASLLGIEAKNQLTTHYSRGGIFESFIVSELIKYRVNKGMEPRCYYWRDKTGNEVDCLIDLPGELKSVEIKAGTTPSDDFFGWLKYWNKVTKAGNKNAYVVYGGKEDQARTGVRLISWRNATSIYK